MKNSRSIIKKLLVAALVVITVCALMVSCGGQQKPTVTISGDVKLNDTDGIGQASLNNIANFMANNAEAYEGIVAAYRGYNILEFVVENGKTYEEKFLMNEDGSFKLNEKGEKIRDVDVAAAKAVLAKYDTNRTLDYEKLDAEDVINLIEKLKTAVTFDVQRGLIDNIMFGIGTALGWITRTIGFGNYIIGICIFAIVLEIVMLPVGIKRQKSSIKQAALRPKEMAIRKKYAGRNDQATMQKVQQEIQEMYQKENFNPASGCLPLLLQLPIILVLYNIVVDPLKHVLGISGNMSTAIQVFFRSSPLAGGFGGTLTQQNGAGSIEVLSKIRDVGLEAFEGIKNFAYFTNGEEVFGRLETLHGSIPSFNIGSVNFGFVPNFNNFNWLLIVPVLTFVVYFASSKLSRKFMYQATVADNQQMGCSNNMMDIMMPAMSVFFTFAVPAAVGVYWMFKSILSTLQQFLLSKVMPLPQFTEEDYKAAERELAGKTKKSTSARAPRDPNAPPVRSLHHIDDEDYDEKGNYRPVVKAEPEEDTKKANTALPEGAAPLKEDAPDRDRKRDKKEKNTEANAEPEKATEAEAVSEEEDASDNENK